ncbi:MAG: CotH kinase family protein, partial [Planctomycetales bacterium]|nr:CotH kinase family protein [Planctomycetales bacterium]
MKILRRQGDGTGRTSRRTRLHLESLESRHLLAGDVVISEFSASNRYAFTDSFGESSDWIELYNRGNESVNLDGWYLTDDSDDLTKWQLPEVELPAGGFLVVSASGLDLKGDTSNLHTNFRLAKSGEYLGLTHPDGTTVSHAYPAYPAQSSDVSYGLAQADDSHRLNTGSVQYYIPTDAASDIRVDEWSVIGFDDTSWQTAGSGLGFDAGGELTPFVSADGDLSTGMLGSSSSAYIRAPFEIDGEVADYDQLSLDLRYDDGFVAYLNGTEIASRNAPEVRAWDTTATQSRAGALSTRNFANFASESTREQLSTSSFPTSFEGERLHLTSNLYQLARGAWLSDPLEFASEFSFSTSFAIDVYNPTVLFDLEDPDADGIGGHGMAFVLEAGENFQVGDRGRGLGLESIANPFFAVEFDTYATGFGDPDDTLPTHVGITTSAGSSLARVPVQRFNGGQKGQDIRHVWVEYEGFSQQVDVYFSETNERPADPILTTTVDLQELFGNTDHLWSGFTAATGYTSNYHDVLSWEISPLSEDLGATVEHIDVTEFKHLLQSGSNVLSIHGMNLDATDDDFLISADITGKFTDVTFVDTPVYFATPTPGAWNGVGVAGELPAVDFSVTGRTFDTPFQLQLSAAVDDASIVYSIDNSAAWQSYTGPIQVTGTQLIRARAVAPGYVDGPIVSQSYIALSEGLTNFESGSPFESNLPLVIFEGPDTSPNINEEAEFFLPTSAIFIDTDDSGRASILSEPDFTGRVGVRTRGQETARWDKRQYALEFWEENTPSQLRLDAADTNDLDVSVFGLPADSDWILKGPYSDKSHLHDYLSFLWSDEIGLYAPRTKFVELFVNEDGGALNYETDYRGTYLMMEKIKIDPNRLDIGLPVPSPSADAEPTTVGGYIWKQDKTRSDDVFIADSAGNFALVEPQTPNTAQLSWITQFVNDFEDTLDGPDFADPDVGYAKYIDIDSWIDYWLLSEFTKDVDAFRLGTYYYLDTDGKIALGPIWDNQLAFGNGNYLDGGFWDGWYHELISGSQYNYYPRLFEDPTFVVRLQSRWFELRETALSTDNMLADIDQIVEVLTDGNPNADSPAPGEASNPISRNFARWGTIDTYLWPNCFFEQGGSCRDNPLPDGQSPDSYSDYIFLLEDFVTNRADWMDFEFGAPPEFNPAGGRVAPGTEVTLTADQPGQILYTRDGSDPRELMTVELDVLPVGSSGQIFVPTSNALADACDGSL